MSGGYCIAGKMTVTGLSDCTGNRNRSVDLTIEATGLVDGLSVGLDEEAWVKDVSQLYIQSRSLYKLF